MKINDVVFDSENKEFVKISNGIEKDGKFVPTEAIAMRVIGLSQNKPVIGYTYRQVKEDKLSTINRDNGEFEAFMTLNKPVHFEFIGRL